LRFESIVAKENLDEWSHGRHLQPLLEPEVVFVLLPELLYRVLVVAHHTTYHVVSDTKKHSRV
jgi:hypothetical protein